MRKSPLTSEQWLDSAEFAIGRARKWLEGDFNYRALEKIQDAVGDLNRARRTIVKRLKDKFPEEELGLLLAEVRTDEEKGDRTPADWWKVILSSSRERRESDTGDTTNRETEQEDG